MNVAIVTIGYRRYAFEKIGDATKLMELLGKGVPVEWQGSGSFEVKPPQASDGEIGLELVPKSRIKPAPKPVPEARRLGYTPPV